MSAHEHTLSRPEQMWITAEINGPGWNLFYGAALILVGVFLAVSTAAVGIEWTALAITFAMSTVLAVAGVMLGMRGLRRVMPLQRLRHHRGARSTRHAEVIGVTSTRELRLRCEDEEFILRGPMPSTQDGRPAADALLHEGPVAVELFAEPDAEDATPAFLGFADGCHAIGYLSRT